MDLHPSIASLFEEDDAPKITVTTEGSTQPMAMGGAYEAADRTSRALALWSPSPISADGAVIPDKSLMDGRSQAMFRNDAYVGGAERLHKDNIVGHSFRLSAKPRAKILGKDEKWELAFREEVETLFELDMDSEHRWIDASRTNTFTEIIRLAVGTFARRGEVLMSAEWITNRVRPFKTAVQMIDPARLQNPSYNNMDANIRGGVRCDKYGAPISYCILDRHPNDVVWKSSYPQVFEYPARKPWGREQIIHIFEQLDPQQHRGVSEIVNALKECKVTKQFRDITLQNAVVQASFAATIESDLPAAEIFARLGATTEEAMEAVTDYMTDILGSNAEYYKKAGNLKIDGTIIPHLPPGSKLNMQSVSNGAQIGDQFESSLLRYIAASLGVSYEELSRDYTKTNYSSARAAKGETWKFMMSRKKTVADRAANAIYRLWLEENISADRFKTFPASMRDMLYTNGHLNTMFDALSRAVWLGAAQGQIDELKETEAAALRVDSNFSTLEYECAKMGKDYRDVLKQRGEEKLLIDKYRLTPIEVLSAQSAIDTPPSSENASSGSKKKAKSVKEYPSDDPKDQ